MAIDEEASIPVIDHSAFVLGDECARVKALAEIDRACRDWGFFQLVNHGLRADRLENILQCTRDFFALPLERKLDLVTPMSPIGFLNQSGASGVVDRKEHLLFFGLDHPSVRHNAWPESPHGFGRGGGNDARVRGFLQAPDQNFVRGSRAFGRLRSRDLQQGIRRLILAAILPGLPPRLRARIGSRPAQRRWDFDASLAAQRSPRPPGSQGRSLDHSEATQKLPRHQRWRRDAGVWTNGRYKSVMHRVVRRENDRFSMAFFHIPGSSTEIAPLEEFTAHEPPKYRKFVQGEYIQLRMKNRSMGNKAKEVTIEHYAV
ncbi:2-oxoacid-dependent dioxygenase [Selaginella moellendorffii]|uniref:2-oxoacid-dependent dioxygenase n=1 Tax=Selaginella moellendorffii TaxID=88036 RepID=D8SEN3_SELML|nr:2-oxoacid-dependent dioxygenase [Selaginella moellendorffii]